jgi:hypothetical protein
VEAVHDADDWMRCRRRSRSSSAVPETVYRQMIDPVRKTQVGNLLIQVHLGSMRDGLAPIEEFPSR